MGQHKLHGAVATAISSFQVLKKLAIEPNQSYFNLTIEPNQSYFNLTIDLYLAKEFLCRLKHFEVLPFSALVTVCMYHG